MCVARAPKLTDPPTTNSTATILEVKFSGFGPLVLALGRWLVGGAWPASGLEPAPARLGYAPGAGRCSLTASGERPGVRTPGVGAGSWAGGQAPVGAFGARLGPWGSEF